MSMSVVEMEKNLKLLHLHGMHATLQTRGLQASQGGSFMEVLACLLQDELDCRRSRMIDRQFKGSGLDERKTLTDFDWGFNPKLPKAEIFDLVTVKFIRTGDDALLIGSPGTGKSHVAKTVTHAAIQNGYKVIFREAHQFLEDLFEAGQLGRRKKVIKTFSDADLLVIDDLFLRKRLPQNAADDLLDIVLNRYSKRKSTLLTSNRMVEDWGKLLNDNAAASAILDRLLHHGRLLKFQGKSYRLKQAAIRLSTVNEPIEG